MKKIILAIFVIFVFLAAAAFADAAVIKVKVTTANVRQQPDATSAVISRATLGTLFEVIKKTGNWFEIAVTDATGKTVTGFINADVVEEIGAPGAPAQPQRTAAAPAYAAPRASTGASGGKFLIMFGPVLSNLSFSEDLGDTKKSARFGLAAGAGYEFPLGTNLSAIGSVFFTTGGANFSLGTDKMSYVANALAVPLQIKYSFNGPFIAAGPYFGLVMSPKTTWDIEGETGEEAIDTANMNTFIFGLILGGGYEMDLGGMKAFVQLAYNLGLSKLNKAVEGSTSSVKPNSINIIFGIKL